MRESQTKGKTEYPCKDIYLVVSSPCKQSIVDLEHVEVGRMAYLTGFICLNLQDSLIAHPTEQPYLRTGRIVLSNPAYD